MLPLSPLVKRDSQNSLSCLSQSGLADGHMKVVFMREFEHILKDKILKRRKRKRKKEEGVLLTPQRQFGTYHWYSCSGVSLRLKRSLYIYNKKKIPQTNLTLLSSAAHPKKEISRYISLVTRAVT